MSSAVIPLVRAGGDPFGVGYQHGQARAEALHAFLDDGLCRINRLVSAPVTMESLAPLLASYRSVIAAATPRLSQEIDGLASGAGLTADQALLLQVRREVIGYQRVPTRGDCTTYASLTAGPGGGPVLAQTVDLNGDLDDQLAVLDVQLDGSARRALVLSFGGLLGYLGVNSDGLAIGLNLVLGGEWRPGLPPYLAIRHLLDSAGTVAQALAILRDLPLASSRCLTLADTGSVACVEILGDEQRLTGGTQSGTEQASRGQPSRGQPSQVTHTNHFLHPDFASRDELNIFARNFSALRLKTCDAALADLAGQPDAPWASVEEHFALLAQPPICVAGNGDIRRERTVAAVVALPGRGELHVRPGDPSLSSTQAFRLG